MKNKLRKEYLTERDNLTLNYRQDCEVKIFEQIQNLDIFNNSKRIFVYVGFGSEISTENFIKKFITSKEIYTPKIVNSEMKLVRITSLDDLEPGHFGVLEAKSNDFYNGEIDLVITPSITFSKDGYRLGYGRGYYDKYFAKNKHKIAIGVCYNKLLKNKVPIEKHDKKVDILITEEGIFTTNEKNNSIY